MIRCSFVLAFAVTACGGGGDDDDTTPDAPANVLEVTPVDPCPGTPDAQFMALASRFEPVSATIGQGQVVKFISDVTHPIAALAGTDPDLNVPESQTKCFRFTMPGTYKFKCTVHGYVGTLTVN